MWSSLFLAAVLAVTPFVDTQQRFHIDLPDGWQFAPQPGDTGGVTFRRVSDGVLVHARVMILPVGQETSLMRFVEQISAASAGEPGYRQLAAERTTLAGRPAFRRRFLSLVNGDPHLPKMAEQRLLVHDGKGYVVHAETLADGFSLFEGDIQVLMRTFALGGGNEALASAPAPHAQMADLTGRWRSRDGRYTLYLSPGGIMTLNQGHGTYHVDQGTLVAEVGGETNVYGLDLAHGQLQLSGGIFADGLSFHRVVAQQPAPGAHRRAKGPRR